MSSRLIENFFRRGLMAAVLVLTCSSLPGVTYTFTRIVDNAPGSAFALSPFSGPFLVNSHGVVAFTAQRRNASLDTVFGIYTSSGGAITTVVEDSTGLILMGFNDAGTVLYMKGLAVYTAAAGGTPFLVVQSSNDFLVSALSPPVINNSGTVAVASMNKIQTRTGSEAPQTLLSDTELPRAIALLPAGLLGHSINNGGALAFYANNVASGTACSCGIYTKAQGVLTSLVPLTTTLGTPPQINDSGAVAFMGSFQGATGVFVASGGRVAAALDLSGQAVTRGSFSFNNNGQVAYHGSYVAPTRITGIFTGPNNVADRVIASGDSLFGGVVAAINDSIVSGRFLNNSGQIAFSYVLNNLVTGIALATPVSSGAPPPTLAVNGILNGASFSAETPTSPGSIVSLFGSDFISQLAVAPGNPLPTSLEGVSVTFNGIPAPLFFVAPGQINAQVPFGVSGPDASVRVTNPAGSSEIRSINLAPQSPAIFTANQNGVGQAVIVFGNTATIVGPVRAGTDWRPARAGDTITIYANGLGAVTPPVNDGWNSCELSICTPNLSNLTLRITTVRPQIRIGTVAVPDNLILFSGLAPQFAGLYQINLTLPPGITPGDSVPVVIQMGNNVSPPNITIALQ
jgi:uncharacterized protein (TIGR03437 family)